MDKQFSIRCLKTRETEDIPLVIITPMVLEIGHGDFTTSVSPGQVCTRGKMRYYSLTVYLRSAAR